MARIFRFDYMMTVDYFVGSRRERSNYLILQNCASFAIEYLKKYRDDAPQLLLYFPSMKQRPGLLHRAIWDNNSSRLIELLETCSTEYVDTLYRGHTPLSFAIMLNRKDCIRILLDATSQTLIKNTQLWSPFNEAVSIGDRDLLKSVYCARRQELSAWMEQQGSKLLSDLSNVSFN